MWLNLLARYLPAGPGAKILDVGCGTGFLSLLAAEIGLDVTGIDFSEAMRTKGQRKARSIEGRVTIRFVLGTDGSVHDVSVTKGARNKPLNVAALDAVHRAAPFPRPPSNLFKGDLSLELTIVFELT